MATTVDEGFRVFHGRLTPTQTEVDAASSHRASVEAKLNSSFGVTNFFQSGSYGNGTSVRKYSDVDYFAGIPSGHQRQNSTTMLNVVRDALKERFPYTPIKVRTPAVVCEFGSDGSQTYEVVPAYYAYQEDGKNVYKIADGSGGWLYSAPRLHTQYVRDENVRLSSKLKPLIRFLKALKFNRDVPVSSFYLELRVTKWSETESSILYSYDVRSMIRNLVDNSLASMRDPKGVSGLVRAATTDARRQDALSKLETALSRANKARDAEQNGKKADAFYWWDMVFDGHFPAYG